MLFNKHVVQPVISTSPKKKKQLLRKPKTVTDPMRTFTKEELKDVEVEFDFKKVADPDLALFVKYYILLGCNGKAAYTRLRNGKVTGASAEVGANKMLRRIRRHPDFLDIMGLGYNNIKDLLMDLKPDKRMDVIMKFNKEDTERVESNITVTLANELSREYK